MTRPYSTNQDVGITCRRCGSRLMLVKDTRKLADGRIRRKRVCRHCGKSRITYER